MIFFAVPSVVIDPNGCPDVQQNYSLTCRVRGLSNSTIQWSRVEGNRLIQQDATLEFFPLDTDDAGDYKCTSVANSSLSATEKVTVNSKSVRGLATLVMHRAVGNCTLCTYVHIGPTRSNNG